MLIDTQIVVWLGRGGDDLGQRSRALLDRHPVYFSSVSVLEVVIKRLKRGREMPADLPALIEQQGLRQLPLTAEHAEAIAWFPELAGHDPFDRALLAQAKAEGLEFLTADRVLLGLGYPWIVDARE